MISTFRALNSIDIILKKLGRQLGDYQRVLLHITIGILAESAHLLDIRDQIHPPVINKLKLVRQVALAKLNQVCMSSQDNMNSREQFTA